MTTPVVSMDEHRTEPKRRGVRALIAILIALVITALAWLVWFSPVLSVQGVRVVGATGAPANAVMSAAQVPLGVPLAQLDAAGIASRVATIPWVGTVEVRRGWPREVVLAVTPRVPVAKVAGTPKVADATGLAFDPPTPPGPLLDIDAQGPALVAAVQVLTGLPDAIRSRVRLIEARTRDDVELQLRSGAVVRWGSAERGDLKAQVLLALLPRRARVYDVTAPELPTTFGERPVKAGG